MRKLLLAALVAFGLSPAFAQTPPAVPALPDTQRLTTYTISGTTCTCAVGFQIYGDNNDVDAWLQVYVNGTPYLSTDPNFGWSISSATGPLTSIPRPITDAVLTFHSLQTGTVQIVGDRRPRRTAQFPEGRGVAARDLNQAFTDIVAQNREQWDRIRTALPGVAGSVGQIPIMQSTGTPAWETLTGDIAGLSSSGVLTLNKSGNTTTLATVSGGHTNGHYAAFDANGNVVDGGTPCCTSGTVGPGLTNEMAYYAANGTAVAASAAQIDDRGTNAREIGVDCTGASDSTTAIQNWVNANPGGHLVFPLGCTFFTSSTITVRNTINTVFRSEDLNGSPGGAPAQWQWKGGNGGAACATSVAACKAVIDFEYADHPVVSNMVFFSGNSGTNGCPDVVLNFDEDGVGINSHISTNGLISGVFVNNSQCVNFNSIGISISRISTSNVENYLIEHTQVFCGPGSTQPVFVRDGVTNGTTTVTSATANFQSGQAGLRVNISYAGGMFDTTIASVTNSTTIVLADAVPFSQTGATVIVGERAGIGTYIGKSPNSIQHYITDYNYGTCAAGIYVAGGNALIDQPKSGGSNYGIYIGSPDQNMSVNYYAAENDQEAIHWWNAQEPIIISNGRLTNIFNYATGFVSVGGFPISFISNQFICSGTCMNNSSANQVQMSTGYRLAPTALGAITGGSGYVPGTYNNVQLSNPTYIGTVSANITVGGGGAVTAVTLLSDPGSFNSFRSGELLTAPNTSLGGSGSGFAVAVGAAQAQFGPGGRLISQGNDYTGNGTITLTQTGLAAWGSGLWSFGDFVGTNSSNSTPGSTMLGCGGHNQSCVRIVQTGQPSVAPGEQLYGISAFTTWPGSGDVQDGTSGFLASGDASTAVANNWTGYRAIPLSGTGWASMTMFLSSPDLASAINLGAGNFYNFKANTPANVSPGAGGLFNSYGLYVAKQKTTNVQKGWGVFQADTGDLNSFGGFSQFGSASLTGVSGEIGLAKITASAVAPGAAGGKIELVCGTGASTAKLIAYAGTSTTPVTILDNIGSGVGGC